MIAIAILGLGSIGLRHAGNFIRLGADVVGFDPDAARRDALREAGGEISDSREAALSGADAVVIASPNRFHLEDLAAAADAGCHVLAEKPLAHTAKGVGEILDRFDDKGLCVFAGFNMRFNPAVEAARSILDGGGLGGILWARFLMSDYLPNWRPHQDYRQGYAADPASGGVLFDMIHEFDLANHLLGPAETLAAAAANSGHMEMKSEDIADVILIHEGGWRSTLHLDYVSRPRRRTVEIAGTGGRLELDLDAPRMRRIDIEDRTVSDETFADPPAAAYEREAQSFLECVTNNATPPCNGRQALAVLEQVIAARDICGLPSA
jgi:predicted dehydrogenase